MSPTLLDALARELFGERYQRPLAASLGVSPSAVSGWLRGDAPVPGPVDASVSAWIERIRSDGRRPPVAPGSTIRFDPVARGGVRGRRPRYAALLAEAQDDAEGPVSR